MSKVWARLVSAQETRILMVGLDAAGKTTVLYKLRLGQVVSTTPTIGFNVETVEYKNILMTVWDIGGQWQIRKLWRHYYQGSHAVIFVVDSSDTAERLDEAREALAGVLDDPLMADVKVLVFANKQDLPNAQPPEVIAKGLSLSRYPNRWHIRAACATTGEGLYEGLDWLSRELAK